MKIMIVDDSASVRGIIRTLLPSDADTFFECGDGDEAVEAYTTVRPDLVLMDIRMRRMDGFEAMKQILARHPDAKIIMVTQYADSKLHGRAKRLGAMDSILKENLDQLDIMIHGVR